MSLCSASCAAKWQEHADLEGGGQKSKNAGGFSRPSTVVSTKTLRGGE